MLSKTITVFGQRVRLRWLPGTLMITLLAGAGALILIGHLFLNMSETRQRIPRMRLLTAKEYNSAESVQDVVHDANVNWRHLSPEQLDGLSGLGRRLFLGENVTGNPGATKELMIVVWKHGPALEKRFLKSYGKSKIDPFVNCSVSNCRISYRDADVRDAHAVLFHLHKTMGPDTLPKTRSPGQRWIFMTDENPHNTFILTKKYSLWDYNGLFNWSMHFRMDADVPVPYGRTIPLTPEEKETRVRGVDHAAKKTKLVAIMGSNCGGRNKRWSYVAELNKHILVDMYGLCGDKKCAGHFFSDCTKLNKYKFYLAFENGDCEQYITEKLWWHGLHKGAVPVVMGAKRHDYEQLLPPDSFIHVDDYETPEELARYLLFLNKSDEDYNRYFRWKTDFKVLNEHGYFHSPLFHYCRICEALNYNSHSPKVYDDLKSYWNPQLHCYPTKWVKRLENHRKSTSQQPL